MLPAIREALSGPDVEGRVCTILLITDGQVWNEAELVAAVANRRDQARFFTMGIDTAISAALLKRLARVGGGTCELLTPSEDIEAAVVRMEACFGSPIAEDVHLERSKPADGNPKSLFIGRPASWLVEDAPAAIIARGKSSGGSFKFETIPVKIEFPLGALWARERIAMLEDWITLRPHEEEAIRPEIVRIALQHQIASRYTAFVAVEKSKKITGERVEIVQPVELPAGWDQTFLGVPGVDQIRGATLKSSVHYAMPAPPLMRDMKFSAAQESRQRPGHVLKRDQVEEKSVTPPRKESLDGQLSRLQGADGSFGGDVKRTAAALLALLLLGHTQRKGIRRRTVLKAAKWLEGYPSDPLASLALEALKREEEDRSSRKLLSSKDDELKELYAAGTEGKLLKQAWDLSK